MNPPGQSITEALHTATLLIYIWQMNPPWSIEHRGLAYHYTAYIYIEREMGDEPSWSINHRGLAYHYTPYIYMADEPPWSIEHRGLAYCYTAYIYMADEPPLVN